MPVYLLVFPVSSICVCMYRLWILAGVAQGYGSCGGCVLKRTFLGHDFCRNYRDPSVSFSPVCLVILADQARGYGSCGGCVLERTSLGMDHDHRSDSFVQLHPHWSVLCGHVHALSRVLGGTTLQTHRNKSKVSMCAVCLTSGIENSRSIVIVFVINADANVWYQR